MAASIRRHQQPWQQFRRQRQQQQQQQQEWQQPHSPPCNNNSRRGFFTANPFSSAPKPTRLVERRRLQVPADRLFEVVLDVDAYKTFLPFCAGSQVTRRLAPDCFEAELLIGFDAFSAGYRSRVTYSPPEPFKVVDGSNSGGGGGGGGGSKIVTGGAAAHITAKSVDSPIFTTMDSYWVITPVAPQQQQRGNSGGDFSSSSSSSSSSSTFGSACDVEFCIEFDMGSNTLLASTVNTFLEDVSAQQIEAFDVRARSLSR
jgi:ribosome-associated toxin RatA of RatAB toxin-antitoxin module